MRQSEFSSSSVRAAIGAWAGFFTGPNAMVASIASLFIMPWSRSFHLDRTQVSGLLLISPAVVAVIVPLIGRAIDRWGVRRVLVPGALVFGISQFAVAGARTPFELVAAILLVSFLAAVQSSVGYVKLISLWFGHSRGTVLSLCVALGAGLGSSLMPQFVRRLLEAYDWRIAYAGMGCVILLIGLPLIVYCVREPARVLQAHAAHNELPGMDVRHAVRTRTFWVLFTLILLASMTLIGTIVHAFPMLTERGFTAANATTAISLIFAGGVCGQLLSGFIADRVESPRIVLPFLLFALVGLVILHTTMLATTMLIGAAICGLGQGAEIALAGYLVSRLFGMRAFAGIYGLIFAASNLGAGIGLMLMGAIHDHFGSYRVAGPVFAGALAVAVLLVLMLGKYRFPSRRALESLPVLKADPSSSIAVVVAESLHNE